MKIEDEHAWMKDSARDHQDLDTLYGVLFTDSTSKSSAVAKRWMLPMIRLLIRWLVGLLLLLRLLIELWLGTPLCTLLCTLVSQELLKKPFIFFFRNGVALWLHTCSLLYRQTLTCQELL